MEQLHKMLLLVVYARSVNIRAFYVMFQLRTALPAHRLTLLYICLMEIVFQAAHA